MKLLLLNPPAREKYVKESRCQHRAAVFQSVYPPLTLAYIASLTRQDNEVRLIDAIGDEISLEKLKRDVEKFDPDLIIVNTTTPTIENDLMVIEKLRGITKAKSAIFGVHATHFARELIKLPQIDIVIKKEPEITAYELTKKNLEDVSGIIYKDNGKIRENPDREFLNPDELPFPAWDLVDLDNYRMPIKNEKYVLLSTGRGCPYRCKFCVSQSYYGRRFRKRSVESVIEEIEYVTSLGIRNFFFFVETFTLDRRFVINLCEEIIRRNLNIEWVCNSRVDTVDVEMLRQMKRAGCWLISFGIESADQRILDNVNKGITVEQSKKAIEITNKVGIATIGHFIFGLPGETQETIKETIEFSKKLPLNFAEFYIATPFPGSELFDELNINPKGISWNECEYSKNIINKNLDLERVRKKAYVEFYLRPSLFLRELKFFGIRYLPSLIIGGLKFLSTI
ncbi:MAG: hypothetical protein DRO90_00550 [Candidatus Altiarchaeales archaeon]|nr:MAG: hypothetical protein DRO95_00900 [Candidatus Altiarchaeales archaeon]RLI95312.1 MAG: hypothetical protein DRO90_00550 [Candidatus Altiarchaeales archaeon]HDO82860.1 radical SAM protein [Candidatus Altiarchaeales archaeon]HEX55509.1 radical SAM protein [Candidatus Altiarchaeales archaeon]